MTARELIVETSFPISIRIGCLFIYTVIHLRNGSYGLAEIKLGGQKLQEEASATEDLRQALADERKNSMEPASKLNQAKLNGENNLRAAVPEEKEKRQGAYVKLNEKYDKLREEMNYLRKGSNENQG